MTDEIVIGHQQYRAAANRNPDFRRTFGELYRRRSLIFIGSGLSESYFINLMSEIILNYGPGVHQHYALFADTELRGSPSRGLSPVDVEFLEVRLGIIPIRYGENYDALPRAIARICPVFGSNLGDGEVPAVQVVLPKALCFEVPRKEIGSQTNSVTEVSFRFSTLPKPRADECVVLSVGLNQVRAPILGKMAQDFLKSEYGLGLANSTQRRKLQWTAAVQDDPRLFRLVVDDTPYPVFALAARDPNQKKADQRNLAEIELVTCAALAFIEDSREFTSVYMGVLAAGDRSFAFPTFPFLAQIRGVRRFAFSHPATTDTALRSIEIRIVDRSIIGPIMAGRLPAQEALASDLVRVLVRVADASGNWESYAIAVEAHQTVGEVLSRYQLPREQMQVRALPLPYPGFKDTLRAPVFPMMLIHVEPRPTPTARPPL